MQRRLQPILLSLVTMGLLLGVSLAPAVIHAQTETPTPTVTPTPSPTPDWIWVATLEATGNTLIVERRFTFGEAAATIAALLVVGVLLMRWAWDISRETR